jgi:DNA-binding MarR family transcriptional regulator
MPEADRAERRAGLLYLIKQLEMGVRSGLEKVLRDDALSIPQYTALSVLQATPGLSSASLARRSFVTAQSAHKLVLSLEKRGLVRREAHPGNRRVLRTYLTASGHDLLYRANTEAACIEQVILASLPGPGAGGLPLALHSCLAALGTAPAAVERNEDTPMTGATPATETADYRADGRAALQAHAAREVENVMNK